MPTEGNSVERIERRSFTPLEVSQRNSFSRAFVYREIQKGRLRARRVGGADGPIRVTAEDETAWLAGAPVDDTPPPAPSARARAGARR